MNEGQSVSQSVKFTHSVSQSSSLSQSIKFTQSVSPLYRTRCRADRIGYSRAGDVRCELSKQLLRLVSHLTKQGKHNNNDPNHRMTLCIKHPSFQQSHRFVSCELINQPLGLVSHLAKQVKHNNNNNDPNHRMTLWTMHLVFIQSLKHVRCE